MHDVASSVLDLILGRSCAGCEQPGRVLCENCAQSLEPKVRFRRDLDFGEVMEGLRIPVVCAMDYRGTTRQILYRYKDHGIRQLSTWLSPALAESVSVAANRAGVKTANTLLSPMPTRRSSLRRRGFDATEKLVQGVVTRVETAGVRRLLIDTRTNGAIKSAGAFEREQRTINAFRVRNESSLPTRPVILIDDIVTTGATIKEAVATLLLSGVHVAAVATVAGTP